MKHHPLPVELLTTEDQRRLADSLPTSKPIPASAIEECIDLLDSLREPKRITVAAHADWRNSLQAPAPEEIDDLLDELREVERIRHL